MLASKFDMKDLGVADVILGIKILKTPNGLALSQNHYIQKILEKFKFFNFKRAKTPIYVNLHLAKNKGESQSQLNNAECWEFDVCYELYMTRHSSRYQ